MSQFSSEDGNVNLMELHENIVEILELKDEETQAILHSVNTYEPISFYPFRLDLPFPRNVPHLLTAPAGHRRPKRQAPDNNTKRVSLADRIKDGRRKKRAASAASEGNIPGDDEADANAEATGGSDHDEDDEDSLSMSGEGSAPTSKGEESDVSSHPHSHFNPMCSSRSRTRVRIPLRTTTVKRPRRRVKKKKKKKNIAQNRRRYVEVLF